MNAAERTKRHGRAAGALAASWGSLPLTDLPVDALAALADHGLRGERREGLALVALEARARRSLAWLAAAGADWPEARAQAEEALAVADAIGARQTAAEALALLGEIELALGLGDPAARFARARGLAESMGTQVLRSIAAFGLQTGTWDLAPPP